LRARLALGAAPAAELTFLTTQTKAYHYSTVLERGAEQSHTEWITGDCCSALTKFSISAAENSLTAEIGKQLENLKH
jgi:hypothetical protein